MHFFTVRIGYVFFSRECIISQSDIRIYISLLGKHRTSTKRQHRSRKCTAAVQSQREMISAETAGTVMTVRHGAEETAGVYMRQLRFAGIYNISLFIY